MVLIVLMMVSILSLSDAWTLDSEKQTAAEKTGEIAADYSTGTETDSNVDSEEAADESTPTETEEEHVHRFTEAETVAPTCTEKGYTIYSCACGKDSYHADETDPLGHDWDDGIVTAEATADEEGSITYTCNICGEQKTETILKLDSIPEEDQDDIQIENNNSRIEKEKNPQKPVSDPSADLEYEEQWDRLFENIVLSGDWGRDLLAIAESQLGYFESSRNFEAELNEEGSGYIIHGWTRYGAWYGVPYGDWCAMFISFCLHYAGIAPDNFPYECGTTTWIEKLVDSGLFREDKDYSPKPGDLIFYDWEEDNFSDHVGIVFSVDEENNEITTIEGNQGNAVRKCDYSLNDRNCPCLLRLFTEIRTCFKIFPKSPVRFMEKALKALFVKEKRIVAFLGPVTVFTAVNAAFTEFNGTVRMLFRHPHKRIAQRVPGIASELPEKLREVSTALFLPLRKEHPPGLGEQPESF